MDREQILAIFEVDPAGVIRTPGAFQGAYLYVPYYWFLVISGYYDRREGEVITFEIRAEDRAQFPELAGRSAVRITRYGDGRIVEIIEPPLAGSRAPASNRREDY
jgi:hypothetical protein